jgi:hypothetical protein
VQKFILAAVSLWDPIKASLQAALLSGGVELALPTMANLALAPTPQLAECTTYFGLTGRLHYYFRGRGGFFLFLKMRVHTTWSLHDKVQINLSSPLIGYLHRQQMVGTQQSG